MNGSRLLARDAAPIRTAKASPDSVLASLKRVQSQLAAAASIDEVKDIIDKAEAVRAYCRKAMLGREIANQAAVVKLYAERRAGEMLAAMEKRQGARDGKTGSRDVTPLSDLGIAKMQSHRWQRIASIPSDAFEKHIAATTAADKEITTSAVLKLANDLRPDRVQQPAVRGVDETLRKVVVAVEAAALSIAVSDQQKLANTLRVLAERVESGEFTHDR